MYMQSRYFWSFRQKRNAKWKQKLEPRRTRNYKTRKKRHHNEFLNVRVSCRKAKARVKTNGIRELVAFRSVGQLRKRHQRRCRFSGNLHKGVGQYVEGGGGKESTGMCRRSYRWSWARILGRLLNISQWSTETCLLKWVVFLLKLIDGKFNKYTEGRII